MPEDKGLHSIKEYLSSHDDPELVSSTIASVVLKNTSMSAINLHKGIVAWREQYFSGKNENLLEILINLNLISEKHREVLYNAVLYFLKRIEDKAFGRRAIYRNLITKEQFNETLAYQKKLFQGLKEIKRVERILRDEGLITAEKANEIWKDYKEFNEKRKKKGVMSEPASVKSAFESLGKPLPPEYEEFLKARNQDLSKLLKSDNSSNEPHTETLQHSQKSDFDDYELPQTPADLKTNLDKKKNSKLYKIDDDDDDSDFLTSL